MYFAMNFWNKCVTESESQVNRIIVKYLMSELWHAKCTDYLSVQFVTLDNESLEVLLLCYHLILQFQIKQYAMIWGWERVVSLLITETENYCEIVNGSSGMVMITRLLESEGQGIWKKNDDV